MLLVGKKKRLRLSMNCSLVKVINSRLEKEAPGFQDAKGCARHNWLGMTRLVKKAQVG